MNMSGIRVYGILRMSVWVIGEAERLWCLSLGGLRLGWVSSGRAA